MQRWRVLAGFVVIAAGSAFAEPSALRWRVVPVNSGGEPLRAVALDAQSGRVAVGHQRGAFTGGPAGVFDVALGSAAVRDLVYVAAGASAERVLIAATDRGLYRVDARGRRGPGAPGPGAASRDALRLAESGGSVAVATSGGAFATHDTHVWRRLSSVLPSGPITAIALRTQPGAETAPPGARAFECWAVIESQLWRVRATAGAHSAAVPRAERITLPFAPGEAGPVDIRLDLPGAATVFLYPRVLAISQAEDDEGAPALRKFTLVRPALPPQAQAVRIDYALDRYWLATDRGLFEAAHLAGPWRRAAAPAGSSPVFALAGDARRLYAASDGKLLLAEPSGWSAPTSARSVSRTATNARESPARGVLAEPDIAVIHSAAIRHLGLSRRRLVDRQRRVRRQGWLPVVSVRASYDRERIDATETDQAFVSGATRHLVDRDHDRSSAYDVGITAAWDLGDVVYEPEEIDVSREERAVLALRDDVLDEITQLYFERRRILEELAGVAPREAHAAERLRLRADELASGIDAWTGGWWSRNAPRLASTAKQTGPDPRIHKENGT
ncbi:MAG: hypothetical protein HRU01_26705 [Myxococcales bacterium]|nr:hypothetical protein [Myxococcales bacterium]